MPATLRHSILTQESNTQLNCEYLTPIRLCLNSRPVQKNTRCNDNTISIRSSIGSRSIIIIDIRSTYPISLWGCHLVPFSVSIHYRSAHFMLLTNTWNWYSISRKSSADSHLLQRDGASVTHPVLLLVPFNGSELRWCKEISYSFGSRSTNIVVEVPVWVTAPAARQMASLIGWRWRASDGSL